MWLAAENGMFLRSTRGDWMTTMPEHSNMEWVDSVKVLIPTLYLQFLRFIYLFIYFPFLALFIYFINLINS